jgi:hypothetical protein
MKKRKTARRSTNQQLSYRTMLSRFADMERQFNQMQVEYERIRGNMMYLGRSMHTIWSVDPNAGGRGS